LAKKKTKMIDKWKLKKWYKVFSPTMFDHRELYDVVSNDEKSLINRVMKVSLMEILGSASRSAMFTTLKLRITDVKGNEAETKLIGHEVSPSYIKTFARRGKSLIHETVDTKTKDGMDLRLKIIAVTGSRVSENTKRNIRSIIIEQMRKDASEVNYEPLMQEILYGRFITKLYGKLKLITKMRKVDIRKTELIETFD